MQGSMATNQLRSGCRSPLHRESPRTVKIRRDLASLACDVHQIEMLLLVEPHQDLRDKLWELKQKRLMLRKQLDNANRNR